MNSLWPSRNAQEAPSERPTGDNEESGPEPDSTGSEQPDLPPVPAAPARPLLQRNQMQAAPPGPAPAPPSMNRGPPSSVAPPPQPAPTDSLSLQQLKRIVAEVNRAEPVAYDFAYADSGPHAEELDEWFVYQLWQWVRLDAAQKAFEWHWNLEAGGRFGWDDADHDMRTRFVRAAIAGLQSNDAALRSASIGKITYLVLGRWGDTAMPGASSEESKSVASLSQLQAIKASVECLTSLEGWPVVWEVLRGSFEVHW